MVDIVAGFDEKVTPLDVDCACGVTGFCVLACLVVETFVDD